MTALLLILSSQMLDAAGLIVALPFGHEANPIMAPVLAAGIGPVIAAKLAAGLFVGVVTARHRPSLAPTLALIGCAGCLSELWAAAG